jgi:hypothetical protein
MGNGIYRDKESDFPIRTETSEYLTGGIIAMSALFNAADLVMSLG